MRSDLGEDRWFYVATIVVLCLLSVVLIADIVWVVLGTPSLW